jgi:hypothetical protein
MVFFSFTPLRLRTGVPITISVLEVNFHIHIDSRERRIQKGETLYNLIFNGNENGADESHNKRRVNSKEKWIEILNIEENIENSKVIEVLTYIYSCKNHISNGKNIAKALDLEVASINSYITSFGNRIINLMEIEEEIRNDGSHRYWNIPFETVSSLNKGIYTWKLRKELIEALEEKYDLHSENVDIETKIKQFIEDNPYEKYMESIATALKNRDEFVKTYSLSKIMKIELDDFVIGKSKIDEKGKESFCYLLETQMKELEK